MISLYKIFVYLFVNTGIPEKYLSNHIGGKKWCLYGWNAMHVQLDFWIRTKNHGRQCVCFHPTMYCFDHWWPWKFYISPNGTPTQAIFKVGGEERENENAFFEKMQILLGWTHFKIRKWRRDRRPYRRFIKTFKEDPEMAGVWQANIAIPILDGSNGKLNHTEANAIADNLMRHLFDVRMNEVREALGRQNARIN